MKKAVSFLLVTAIIVPVLAQNAATISKENEKAYLNKNAEAFHKLIEKYDDEYIPDILLDKADGIKISGSDFSIDAKTLIDNCAEEVAAPQTIKKADKAFAETLGYEVTVSDDSVTLSQPYQSHRLIVKGKVVDNLDSLEILPLFDGIYIVQFDDLESTLSALEHYEKQENIEYVNPDTVISVADYKSEEDSIKASGITDISLSSTSWGSSAIGFNTAFKTRLGLASLLPSVKVAVVDTGVSLKHTQIKSRLIETGFNNSGTGSEDSEADDNGHGTHVAGIIAQNTLSNVKIMGYKVLNSGGNGAFSNMIVALRTAYADGAQVVNLSLSGNNKANIKDVQKEVFEFLSANNVVCCVAAGNEGIDCRFRAPAKYGECITVGAMDRNDEIPSWCNYGSCVDIIAPGVDISSADYSNIIGYVYKSGTSMATPFVAATAADILSKNSAATPSEIKDFLRINGRDINAPELFYGAPALYLGSIESFEMIHPQAPVFSVESGNYTDGITVSLTSPDNAEIYYGIWNYSLNGIYISSSCPTKYSEPVEISDKCNLVAVCIKNYGDISVESEVVFKSYFFDYTNNENYFNIDENGTITEYKGNQNDVYIPDTVNGVEVTAIGNDVFTVLFSNMTDKNINYLRTIRLPATCTKIGNGGFSTCVYLTDIYFGGTKEEWHNLSIGNNNVYFKNANVHLLSSVRDIASFDGENITLLNDNSKTSAVPFSDYVNTDCEALDVVDDGIINAKDYAYLLKNYN